MNKKKKKKQEQLTKIGSVLIVATTIYVVNSTLGM